MARKVFALFGVIGLEGAKGVFDKLEAIDKKAKQLSKELMVTGKQLETLGKKFTVSLTAPIVAAGTAIAVMTTRIGEMADRLLDLKEITGLSTDTLQELQHVSKTTGGNFESLVSIISKFSNKIPEIEKGGTAASKAFSKLGVPLKDSNGQIRDMNELFFDMLDGLHKVENVTSRNALAQDIFGKSLEEVAPILALSTKDLAEMRKEAHSLGLVLTETALVDADNMRGEIEKVKEQFIAAGRSIAVSFLPVLRDSVIPLIKESVIPAIKDMAEKIKMAVDWFNALSPTTKENTIKFLAIAAAAGPVLMALGGIMKAIAGLRATILLLNAAMFANPYVLIAAGVIGLTALILKNNNAFGDNTEAIKKNNDEMERGRELRRQWREELKTNPSANAKQFEAGFNKRWSAVNTGSVNSMEQLGISKQAYSQSASPTAAVSSGGGSQQTEDELKRLNDLHRQAYEMSKEWGEKEAEADYNAKVKMGEDITAWGEKSAQADYEAKVKIGEEITKLSEEAAEADYNIKLKWAEKFQEKVKYFQDLAIDSMYQAFDIFQGINENKQIELDNSYYLEKQRIENSTISEVEKQRKINELDEKTAKKKRQLIRKSAQIEKVAGIFSVGISTAQAIMKAFATLAYPLNIVAAAFAGAMGIAQTAVIAAKPLPEAEKGAFLPGTAEGTAIRAGEKNKPEIILPLDIGVGKLATALVGKINSFAQPVSPISNLSALGSGGMTMNVNVGNFIGSRSSLREFEETMSGLRIERIDRRA